MHFLSHGEWSFCQLIIESLCIMLVPQFCALNTNIGNWFWKLKNISLPQTVESIGLLGSSSCIICTFSQFTVAESGSSSCFTFNPDSSIVWLPFCSSTSSKKNVNHIVDLRRQHDFCICCEFWVVFNQIWPQYVCRQENLQSKFFFGNGPYFSVIERPSFGFGRRLHLSWWTTFHSLASIYLIS